MESVPIVDNAHGRVEVLRGRLALLGDPKDGEDPQTTKNREALRARIAALEAELVGQHRLPYRDN